jgi:Protein of unknown function (DUF2829)
MSWSTRFDFRYALDAVTHGRQRITRDAWPEGSFVFLHRGTKPEPHNFAPVFFQPIGPNSTMGGQVYHVSLDPFLCFKSHDGSFAEWHATSADLLANDWRVVQ